MKKTKFTDEQIAFALRQAETGARVGEVCRKIGIADTTFYNWKKKYSGLGVSEVRLSVLLRPESQKTTAWEEAFAESSSRATGSARPGE